MTAVLQASNVPPADRYDVALLDLDGVVYVGGSAVAGVPAGLATARERGVHLAFVTNNAARPPAVVAAHLSELGIEAQAGEVITSSQSAARYLAEQLPTGALVLVLGTTGLYDALEERGLRSCSEDTEEVAAVVQGYSPDMNWRLLAEGSVAIRRGVPWVATNVDPTVPSPRGPLPGNGSLVAALRHATGATPVVTGKPDPTMHRETLIRTGAERPIVVGDRLDTDIEGANAVGCDSMLVLSGVTTPRELLSAPEHHRPTYVAIDATGLLAAQPETTVDGDTVTCGRWRVVHQGAEATLSARDTGPSSSGDEGATAVTDDDLDALRALTGAYWARGEAEPRLTVRADGDPATRAVRALGLST